MTTLYRPELLLTATGSSRALGFWLVTMAGLELAVCPTFRPTRSSICRARRFCPASSMFTLTPFSGSSAANRNREPSRGKTSGRGAEPCITPLRTSIPTGLRRRAHGVPGNGACRHDDGRRISLPAYAPDGHPYDDPNLLSKQVIAAAQSVGIRIVSAAKRLSSLRVRAAARSGSDAILRDDVRLSREHGSACPRICAASDLSDSALRRTAFAPCRSTICNRLSRGPEQTICRCTCTWPSRWRRTKPVCANMALLPLRCLGKPACWARTGPLCTRSTSLPRRYECLPMRRNDLFLSHNRAQPGRRHPRAGRVDALGIRVAFGSDSQAQIDPLEDARELEYHLRLERIRSASSSIRSMAADLSARLFDCATVDGAQALRLRWRTARGRLAPRISSPSIFDDPSIAGASRGRSAAPDCFRHEPDRNPRCCRERKICHSRWPTRSPGRNYFPLRRGSREGVARFRRCGTMKTVVDFLSDMIRIPSNSAVSNRPLVEYAKSVLHAAGWSTRELPYTDPAGAEKVNLIAAPPGQDVNDRDVDLVFMCHTDTVPYAADWANALNPIVKDGNLHGCGACDVKGFLACLLTVIAKSHPTQLPDGLRLVLTAEEEIGCIGAARLHAADVLRPRRMVIGEPTLLRPARAGKGYCLAEVTVCGKEAHSAHPQQGVSAIYNAARLITAIEEFATHLAATTHSFFDPGFTTMNVGTIRGRNRQEHRAWLMPTSAGVEADSRRARQPGSRRSCADHRASSSCRCRVSSGDEAPAPRQASKPLATRPWSDP